jgi:hypothetical protein
MRKPRIATISKDTARRELAAALANYRGTIKRCPPGGSSWKTPAA